MVNTIDSKIKNALKNKEKDRLYVLRMIKAKFLEFETAKNAKPLDIAAEIQILKKMNVDWNKELETLKSANRDYSELQSQIDILNEYIPEPPSKEQIKFILDREEIEKTLKNSKVLIEVVKMIYPAADNKVIIECIKEYA